MLASYTSGFALGFSLILAIGAQNAFVLRQGLRREHVFAVCLLCAVSDAALIAAGVAGFGTLARTIPWFEPVMRYGGAAFLTWYGWTNLRSAWEGGQALKAADDKPASLTSVLATVSAFT
ncbi:MAG: LysE/ArgO family amino acid transporter, partial [Paracoccaceae bacterium]